MKTKETNVDFQLMRKDIGNLLIHKVNIIGLEQIHEDHIIVNGEQVFPIEGEYEIFVVDPRFESEDFTYEQLRKKAFASVLINKQDIQKYKLL